ncbi:ATP-binding protein [Streptomyces sp. NPDC096311]|uniref:ATP-binding protein n=1 Tax=Streptomyces sp. NPDC096311 TaxID=3366083 RepID=UPI0037F4C907
MTPTSAISAPGIPHPTALGDPLGRQHRRPAPAAPRTSAATEACHAVVAVPADASRIRDVRRYISAVLAQWGLADDDLDSCVLIVAELANNSAQHGRSDLTVFLSLRDHTLHIDVADRGADVERPSWSRPPSTSGEHGRGLGIVQALSDECDIRRQPSGWRTRARLRLVPAGRQRHPAGFGFPGLAEANAPSAPGPAMRSPGLLQGD